MSKLNLNDLLTNLQKTGNKQVVSVPKFVEHVVKDSNKKINVLTKKQEEMMRRETNYEMAKEEMDKWVGIIKVNREKQSLNFTQKEMGNTGINFFPSQPINQFHKKLQSKLQGMNIQSQKAVLKHEQAVLQKVDPEEAKRRLIEARKHRSAVFYQEQKRRRISKIKSKLYHKIKKRQKMREQNKKIDQMTPTQKSHYIENLTKQRIKQRLTLRHGAKNKHIQNLLRFNRSQKNGIQASINELNQIRHKELERMDPEIVNGDSEEYDDENFREQAMKDLQAEIQAIQREEEEGHKQDQDEDQIDAKLKDLKFIKNAKEKRIKKQKEDAYKIFNKLAKGKDLKQKDVNSDMESEQGQQGEKQSDQDYQDAVETKRKVYGKKIKQDPTQNAHKESKSAQKTIQSELKSYLLGGKINQTEQDGSQLLTKGINLENLQRKYQPERVTLDLTELIAGNKEIYGGQVNDAAIENVREFEQEKYAEIEAEVNKNEALNKSKNMKGWGNWTGPGIAQRKVNPQEQLRKKLKMIQEIKRKRKDNALAHVTITQTRNKALSDYMVKDLPRNFSNPDQFDFMQSQPVGPEWNTLNQFQDNIKPKVITAAGQVITPAKLPKKLQKGKGKKI